MKISRTEILAIVIFGLCVFGFLFLVRSAEAGQNEDLERFIAQESESITSRLDRGEVVEMNGTKLVKRNGVVYGVGNSTPEEKEQYRKDYEKRIQEQKESADLEAERNLRRKELQENRDAQIEIEKIRSGK
jgi:hypothetical protein